MREALIPGILTTDDGFLSVVIKSRFCRLGYIRGNAPAMYGSTDISPEKVRDYI